VVKHSGGPSAAIRTAEIGMACSSTYVGKIRRLAKIAGEKATNVGKRAGPGFDCFGSIGQCSIREGTTPEIGMVGGSREGIVEVAEE
jgi:hypothetical protein